MQIFLPYPSFSQSAACLDRLRLGKQRVEAWQVLRTLLGESQGWANHPAVLMWRGHEGALALYGVACCNTWLRRGYRDSLQPRFTAAVANRGSHQLDSLKSPSWLGDPALHSSHRSNLLRKDPVHYGKFGWAEPADLPYVWPVKRGK